MGTTYQTILVAGDLADIRAGISTKCVVLPVGERRWAVIPHQEDGYAETEELARHLSRPPGALTAAFQVFDSDILAALLFRAGAGIHEYLSEQAYLEPYWEEDGTEVQMDFLGRPYGLDEQPPTGPYGADPAMFAPLADGQADEPALAEALTGREPMADHRHHELLHALNLWPRPLQSTYARAASDPEAIMLPG